MTTRLLQRTPPLLALSLLTWACPARAQLAPCVIPPAGEVVCEEALIEDTIRVSSYDPASASPTGYLHIRAHRINITESGIIDATGSGHATTYVGSEPTDGGGPGGGLRGTPLAAGSPAPGGGGAHVGVGGQGVDDVTLCTLSSSAFGGTAYDDASAPAALMDPFDALRGMGSAGGASYCGDSGAQLRAGGRGGGVVILTAGVITVAGQILAGGQGKAELGPNLLRCGPGAGAGGSIILRSHNVTLTSSAVLRATGGESPRTQDANMVDATNSWGGAGGGGLITIFATSIVSTMNALISGGAADCMGGRGGDGAVAILDPPSCLDADGDGHSATICGGEDCNDGSTEISPDGAELCDGIDNDCDGDVDEDADELCPIGSGTSCVDGACVVVSDGDGGGTSVGPVPEIELGGGLCAASPGPTRRARWSWLACVAVVAWRRRQQRRRQQRRRQQRRRQQRRR